MSWLPLQNHQSTIPPRHAGQLLSQMLKFAMPGFFPGEKTDSKLDKKRKADPVLLMIRSLACLCTGCLSVWLYRNFFWLSVLCLMAFWLMLPKISLVWPRIIKLVMCFMSSFWFWCLKRLPGVFSALISTLAIWSLQASPNSTGQNLIDLMYLVSL